MAALNIRLINSPDSLVVDMLLRKLSPHARELNDKEVFGAVALVQTNLPNIYYYADIAVKAADVKTYEMTGSCPQHISTLAILGSSASVKEAVRAIQSAE